MNPPFATASLYVGDLEGAVTESTLYDFFKRVGQVSSIRVCRDAATRRSLGYAYVNFANVTDAERAIDTLNYTTIGSGTRPCRIMWSHRDPSVRRSGKGNIYIKNLDKSIDHKALCDTFSAFGNILSAKVAMDRLTGESKGFGFVHYESEEAALAAIEQVNGMLLCGKKVFVGEFLPRSQRGDSSTDAVFTNVFVKDLSLQTDDAELRQVFAQFGEITSALVMRDGSGVSKGFGFINYAKPEAARAAVEELNGTLIGDKKIFVARAQKKSDRESQLRSQFEERKSRFQESNVYVKNLAEDVDEEKLKEVFSPHGKIVSITVMRDEKNVSKGFGFVCYSTPEEAHKAIAELLNHPVNKKPLFVALAQRKEVRAAQLQAQYAHRVVAGRGLQMPPAGAYPPGAYPPMGAMGGIAPAGRAPYPGATFGAVPPTQQGGRPPRWNGPQGGAPHHQNQQGGGRGRGRGGNQNRNNHQGGGGRPAQQPFIQTPAPPKVVEAQAPAQHASLADLSEKDRKQVLGEFLYPKVELLLKNEVRGDVGETGKVTGMLLESLDHGELVHLLESHDELKSRVEEAINVLREHMAATQHQ